MKRFVLFFATLWLGVMGANAQKYHYDVNNDGSVNITDATLVVNKVLGKDNPGDPGNVGGGEAVDLGLPSGTKWASFNIGATSPEQYGEYFAWGELGEKQEYTEDNYQFYVNGLYMDLGTDIGGTKYDVARMRWGGDWRMPTEDEIQELIDNCTYEWTTYQGVAGGKFTSKKNGNSIFLPAAGYRWDGSLYYVGTYGGYWSSTPSGEYDAYGLYFYSYNAYWYYWYYYRYYEHSVRPVR
ncbi:MAG: hypothetical protein IJK42_04855 [Prevotella sp.]|nr:hypothetical protein [Prevotella sp.]